MSVSYIVWPFDPSEEIGVKVWGVAALAPSARGRWPTVAELRHALEQLEGYEVDCSPSQADIVKIGARCVFSPQEWREHLLQQGQISGWEAKELESATQMGVVIEVVDGPNTLLDLRDATWKGTQSSAEFSTQGHWPEVTLDLVERLSEVCGPLAVIMDAVGIPVVITPGADLREAETHLCGGAEV